MEGSSVPAQALTNVRFEAPGTVQIPEGSILSLRVVKRSGRWVHLAGASIRITAKDGAHLQPGEVVSVRATRTEGRLVLEILQRRPSAISSASSISDLPRPGSLINNILASLNLADTPGVRALLTAIVVSRRSVSEQLIRKSLKSAEAANEIIDESGADRSSKSERAIPEPVRARWALEWADRDIPVAQLKRDHLRELLSWFAGGNPEYTERGSGNNRRRGGEERDSSHPEERQIRPTAKESLKDYLFRSEPVVTHPLQVYNHLLPATGELHWLVLPVGAFSLDNTHTAVRAVLKVAVDIRRHRPVRAILSVEPPEAFHNKSGSPGENSDEEPLWWFYWTLDEGVRLRKTGYQGNVSPPPESLLATLGGTGHTENIRDEDGLSVFQETAELNRIVHYG